MKDPETSEEWQEAVDLAAGLLAINAAQLYGFVRGGPAVDVVRCEGIIARGTELGYGPTTDALERVARAYS